MNNYEYTYSKNEFSVVNSELMLDETIFHNANGYIGVRGNFEEGYPEGYSSIRGQYINGFYDITDMNQAEKLYGLIEKKQTILNIADTQSMIYG
ncbi:MAG: treP [Bacillota bacterium]|jgi:alpha,alpha-trehalose phosphorylase|nr:treP [Bacillota bacterium]